MDILLRLVLLLLWVLTVIGIVIGVVFAFKHADAYANRNTPITEHERATLKRYVLVCFYAGLFVLVLLTLRLLIQKQNIWTYLMSVGIYKAFLIPGCWVISYLLPSKRKKKQKQRRAQQTTSQSSQEE